MFVCDVVLSVIVVMVWCVCVVGVMMMVMYEGRTRSAYAFDVALRVATLRRSVLLNVVNEFLRM